MILLKLSLKEKHLRTLIGSDSEVVDFDTNDPIIPKITITEINPTTQ